MHRITFVVALPFVLAAGAATAQEPQKRRLGPPDDRVDVEVVYVKFPIQDPEELEKLFAGKLAEAIKGIEVEESEWFYRHKANKPAYDALKGPVAVKKQVKREVRVAKLLSRLLDKVTPKTDLLALAKENGLSFHRYEKASRLDLQVQPEIGSPRAMMMVWGSGVQKLEKGGFELGNIVPYETTTKGDKEHGQPYWPRIFDEPGNFMALFRLVKVYPDPARK